MKMSQVEQFRRFMPKQFTRMTKLCAKCGNRVKWDDEYRGYVCARCKTKY